MFFAMISRRFLCHLYTALSYENIVCTMIFKKFWKFAPPTLCPSIMRPKQRLMSGELHVMGKLHIKFQENRARNVLSVKNRNTYVMKFSFFEKNIFCLKSYRSAAWQDILHKKENQSLDLSFF